MAAAPDLEQQILNVCEANAQGACPADVLMALTGQPKATAETKERATEVMEVLNKLAKKGKLEMLSRKNVPFFRVVSGENKFAGMSKEERLVYQTIQKAGNKGIWTRDIRFGTNLDMKLVNKILKTMESRKMVKAVTSVVAAKKKMYMLFELEPDQSLTGGPWYSDQDFEAEFIDGLRKLSFTCLEQRARKAAAEHQDPMIRNQASFATSGDVLEFIVATKFSFVQLKEDNVEGILETLVFDGKVDAVFDAGAGRRRYKVSNMPPVMAEVLCAPCGVCPVFQHCAEGSVVSPSTCIYLPSWMEI